ncbi:hypothetical protein T439DRAFT_323633 [Meredithblackwellia eburnea MCA 4105]
MEMDYSNQSSNSYYNQDQFSYDEPTPTPAPGTAAPPSNSVNSNVYLSPRGSSAEASQYPSAAAYTHQQQPYFQPQYHLPPAPHPQQQRTQHIQHHYGLPPDLTSLHQPYPSPSLFQDIDRPQRPASRAVSQTSSSDTSSSNQPGPAVPQHHHSGIPIPLTHSYQNHQQQQQHLPQSSAQPSNNKRQASASSRKGGKNHLQHQQQLASTSSSSGPGTTRALATGAAAGSTLFATSPAHTPTPLTHPVPIAGPSVFNNGPGTTNTSAKTSIHNGATSDFAGPPAILPVADEEKRGRKSNSCAPCRKRKMRCDRCSPCSSCVSRGEAHACTWEEATPLYSLRSDNDVKELKNQVERLQNIVDSLTGALHAQLNGKTQPSDNTGAASKAAGEVEIDMRAGDLCTALSQLAIAGIMPPDPEIGVEMFAPGGINGDAFVEEARQFMTANAHVSNFTENPPVKEPASATSPPKEHYHSIISSIHTTPPTVSQILSYMPTRDEAIVVLEFYLERVVWYARPFNVIWFREKWDELNDILELPHEERDKKVDLAFLATFYATCAGGMGRLKGPSNATALLAHKYAVAAPVNQQELIDKWTKGAMMALMGALFVESPSPETIRAAMIISLQGLYLSTAEKAGASLGLLSIAVQGAFTIGMHRDPKRHKNISFAEAEDRRAIFWNLFTQCMTATWIFGRTWNQFDLNQIDCALPLECHDKELMQDERAARAACSRRSALSVPEETPLTVPLIKAKVALLTKQSCDVAFGLKPVKYSVVLDLHKKLRDLEDTLPPLYQFEAEEESKLERLSKPPTSESVRANMVHILIACGYMRLHRPWMILGGTDERFLFSRQNAVHYAKRIISINASKYGRQNVGGHNYKTLTAAIVLAVEVMQTTDEADAAKLREEVERSLTHLTSWREESTIARKGSNIVRFLLQKIDQQQAKRQQPRDAKRVRVSEDGDAQATRGPSYALYDVFNSWGDEGVSGIEFGESELRHKGDLPLDFLGGGGDVEFGISKEDRKFAPRPNTTGEFWDKQMPV